MMRHFSHIRLVEAETFILMRPDLPGRSGVVFGPENLRFSPSATPASCTWVLDDDARDLAHVATLATANPFLPQHKFRPGWAGHGIVGKPQVKGKLEPGRRPGGTWYLVRAA